MQSTVNKYFGKIFLKMKVICLVEGGRVVNSRVSGTEFSQISGSGRVGYLLQPQSRVSGSCIRVSGTRKQ